MEGPRRAAEVIGTPAPVGLRISIASSPAHMQTLFDQGVHQVFGRSFFEALRSFQTILIEDPDCPMAYWGLGQASVEWPVRAKWFARAAWLKRGLAGPRERRLIDALARYYDVAGSDEPSGMVDPWNPAPGEEPRGLLFASEQSPPAAEYAARLAADYRAIAAEDPTDLLARTLLTGHLVRTRQGAERDEAIEAELSAIFEVSPRYPAHAHRLHLWLSAGDTARAVASAERLSSSPYWGLDTTLAAAAIFRSEGRDADHHAALKRADAFAWKPFQAPDWTLDDAYGQTFSLEDYRGKPLLIVNFLGFGCVHCLEQLQALLPFAEKFEELGVEIVAIGLQTPEELRVSMGDDPLKSGYPFPILCDPKLGQFKAYHSFDDFADTALHGTYLLDADGHVRWLDISHLPYMDIASILKRADAEAR